MVLLRAFYCTRYIFDELQISHMLWWRGKEKDENGGEKEYDGVHSGHFLPHEDPIFKILSNCNYFQKDPSSHPITLGVKAEYEKFGDNANIGSYNSSENVFMKCFNKEYRMQKLCPYIKYIPV